MTSERDKCGLSSLLPLSCRDRAEAFARSLQSRLNSLGSHNSSSEERSWLGSHENTIALSQPLHNPEAERYLALEVLESPSSPQEEIEESELHKLLNKDHLREKKNGDCYCPQLSTSEIKYNGRSNGMVRHYSGDSDNDVFYDLEDDTPSQTYTNGLTNSESSKSIESETGIDVNSQGTSSSNPSETFATSLDCTPQASESDEIYTVSLKDDISLDEANSICEDCERSRKDGEVNNIVENLETELRINENEKCSGNGEVTTERNESDIDVSNLTIPEELTVESKIGTEQDKTDESDSFRLCENGRIEEVEDEDNDDQAIPRVRRCSSLKTGKTPPGTPGRKKIVRFADVLGLDLADVRTFLDEIPKVPKSAYDDLSDVDLSDGSELNSICNGVKFHGIQADRILAPMFDQPAGLPNYLDLVRDNLVCLENAIVEDPILFLIRGTVRVRNLDFHKSVHIRYTLDSWKTFADVQATYVSNSCDGFSDRFSFLIYAHTLTVGQKIEFACRFQCKGCQYWDSNGGRNYCFQCLPAVTSNTTAPVLVSTGHADWGASEKLTPFETDNGKRLCIEATLRKSTNVVRILCSQNEDSAMTEEDAFYVSAAHEVQDFVLRSLQCKNEEVQKSSQSRTKLKAADLLAMLLILLISFCFLYLQEAIYFTK